MSGFVLCSGTEERARGDFPFHLKLALTRCSVRVGMASRPSPAGRGPQARSRRFQPPGLKTMSQGMGGMLSPNRPRDASTAGSRGAIGGIVVPASLLSGGSGDPTLPRDSLNSDSEPAAIFGEGVVLANSAPRTPRRIE